MGNPAAVMGDQVTATCIGHQVPGPTGNPVPAPPLPFSAPLLVGLCGTVLISSKPAAVVGSMGFNTPPHVGLYPSDPFLLPTAQTSQITLGSSTVFFGGQPAAHGGSQAICCIGAQGVVLATAVTVLIGG